jgi:DNA topoisomerase-2
MSKIRVTISADENLISIENNGRDIPITIHKEEKIYVPELIFGHLLTSSNYNDDEKKVVGGRNGYGAKLCNIFSTDFTVETGNKEAKLKYRQNFKNNMSHIGKPTITKGATKDFTRITFNPDLRKFHMESMDQDFESLIKKRVYDLAGCVKGVTVYLNGTKIPVQTFPKYCDLYAKNMELRPIVENKFIVMDDGKQERWQVGFGVSDGQFTQVSYRMLSFFGDDIYTSILSFLGQFREQYLHSQGRNARQLYC